MQQRDQAQQDLEDVKDVIRSSPQLVDAYNAQLEIREDKQKHQQKERGHEWDR